MINYLDENVHFEIFIADQHTDHSRKIAHTCIEVDDMQAFLDKCSRLQVDVARIPKGDKILIFIKDFDGNVFEIKRSALLEDRPAARD